MTLSPGARLGPYEISGAIGAGGMGEVYRARDTKLNRDVAIKVLPAAFAQDHERVARFRREAQLLASLNHPNIAAIHGLEESDGRVALALELVEGEDLAVRLKRGAIPVEEAITMAKQIAEALEEAHEHGIVHRDLKPANVKVTADGKVKVLDFGLAKAYAGEATSGSPADISQSPTLAHTGTQAGVILGTPAYMSPEQARGKAVDKRADIWAFGVVLFEMLAGKRLFDGETGGDVLAAVLTREPDWARLPAALPGELRRLIGRCLERDPKARLRDIGEARVLLEQLPRGAPAAIAPQPGARPAAWKRGLPWGLAAALGVLAAGLYARAWSPRAVPGQALRSELVLPEDVEFSGGPSISADGSRVAFVGLGAGVRQVYLRTLEETVFRPVAGTESASNVGLSPDGRRAAFVVADRGLKLVDLATGVVEPLTTGASTSSAAVWFGDGSLLFSRGDRIVVRSSAGAERDIVKADQAAGEGLLSWPVPVDGDKAVLFVSRRRTPSGMRNRLELVASNGNARRMILDGVGQAIFASAERLVFERDGALFVGALGPAGVEPASVSRLGESVSVSPLGGAAAAVSRSGVLVSAPRAIRNGRLVWIAKDGTSRAAGGGERGFLNPRVSPDGGLIAFSESGSVWTLDPKRDTFNRLTGDEDPLIGFPLWSLDGKSLYFRSPDGIRRQNADGAGGAKILPGTSATDYPSSLTPDGSTLYLMRQAAATGGDIYTTPAEGGEVKPFLVTNAYEGAGQVSPDGKWLLYVSNEAGRMQVYVRPIGGPDRKWLVSSQDSHQATWSRDGRQIFYRSGAKMMSVEVTTVPEMRMAAPRVLLENRRAYGQNLTIPNYSVSPDGREFLMVESDGRGRYLNLVLNWLEHGLGK